MLYLLETWFPVPGTFLHCGRVLSNASVVGFGCKASLGFPKNLQMPTCPTSRAVLSIYAIVVGVLGTFVGTAVGAIPGMIAYRAAIQSGGIVMEYFLMIVAACSLWFSSIFMMIVTAFMNDLSKMKRTVFVAMSLIPGSILWIGIGLSTDPVWFRTTGAVIGVFIGLLSLVIPLLNPSVLDEEPG